MPVYSNHSHLLLVSVSISSLRLCSTRDANFVVVLCLGRAAGLGRQAEGLEEGTDRRKRGDSDRNRLLVLLRRLRVPSALSAYKYRLEAIIEFPFPFCAVIRRSHTFASTVGWCLLVLLQTLTRTRLYWLP